MLRKSCKLEKVYFPLPELYIHDDGMLKRYGYYKIIGKITLEKALELVSRNRNSYTSIYIHENGCIIYNINIEPAKISFYCDLSFRKMRKRVKRIEFNCFANTEHVDIYL